MSELARVIDREELEDAPGPRGSMSLDVLQEWLVAAGSVEIVVPSRLPCARCDGGGCDGCGRSGGIRLDGDEVARTFQFALPRSDAERILVRLVRPLGEDAGLEQLALEIRAGVTPSEHCRWIEPPPAPAPPPPPVALAIAQRRSGARVMLVMALAMAVTLAFTVIASLR